MKLKGVTLGIGDDAAILSPSSKQWVWTIDACVQNVHFDMSWLSPEDIGWRSLQAAVSDIAAMGAKPVAALSSIALPLRAQQGLWRGVARGQARAAKALACPIIGGNMSRASELSVHTTVLGHVRNPILRGGARAGDELWLVGVVGAAAAGLAVLRHMPENRRDAAMRACVHAWRRPRALVKEGSLMHGRASAAIDVSDGVAGDALHIADSSEAALVLDADALERAAGTRVRRVARTLGKAALDWVLAGGEDYALLAAGKPEARPSFARRVGHVESGRGVWLVTDNGKRRPAQTGFDHFASSLRS
jgi:thiamine-monophosphate kinase